MEIKFSFCCYHLRGCISPQEQFYFGGGEYEPSYFIHMGHDHRRYNNHNRYINRRDVVMKVRGTAHEYWIERRRARLQARRRGEGGPYRSQGFCQEKKIKKYEKNI